MKLNKIMLVAAMALGVSAFANAATGDQGKGKVTFTGSIVSSPCSISADSVDQTVELGQISTVVLGTGSGQSKPRNFEIKLEQCKLDTPYGQNLVTVTFTGDEAPKRAGFLGISGTAAGASIGITDTASVPVLLGKPTKAYQLTNNNNTLRFAAYLKADPSADDNTGVTEGDFTAVADFTLAYQ